MYTRLGDLEPGSRFICPYEAAHRGTVHLCVLTADTAKNPDNRVILRLCDGARSEDSKNTDVVKVLL